MKKLLLALIPVALLASVSFAYPGLTTQSSSAMPIASTGPNSTTSNPVLLAQAPYTPPATTTQPQPQPASQQPAAPPAPVPAPAPEVVEEPIPLIVDKTQLVEAAALLERAILQAKLAADAVNAPAQQAFIQETINLLAGSANVHFKPTGQATATYAGVVPLLSQALVTREAAEEKWLLALEQRDSQIYVAGPGGTIPPAATSTI